MSYKPYKSYKTNRKPSKGTIAFSISLLLIGLIGIISIAGAFFQLTMEREIPQLSKYMPLITYNSTVFWLSTLFSSIIMFSWIISGIGLLFLKEWARQLLFVSIGIYFLNSAINLLINITMIKEYEMSIPYFPLALGIIFVLSFSISISYFFSHPKVIRQFK